MIADSIVQGLRDGDPPARRHHPAESEQTATERWNGSGAGHRHRLAAEQSQRDQGWIEPD